MIRQVAAAAGAAFWTTATAAGGLLPGDGPVLVVTSASLGGPTLYSAIGAVTLPKCPAQPGPVLLYFAFADPDGIEYAAVDIRADGVRPVVSDRAETWLWIPAYAREMRAYRWRVEDEGRLETRRIIPVAVEIVPGDEPLHLHVEAKDGAENLEVMEFTIDRASVTCR